MATAAEASVLAEEAAARVAAAVCPDRAEVAAGAHSDLSFSLAAT